MKIPKSIKIGGHTFKVKAVTDKEMSENAGDFSKFYQTIRINKSDAIESRMAEVLLHEIFEAIININEIELEHPKLTAISEHLFAIIRDNNLDFRE